MAVAFVVHSFLTSTYQNIIGVAKAQKFSHTKACKLIGGLGQIRNCKKKSELKFPLKIHGHGGIISCYIIYGDYWWCKYMIYVSE